MEANVARVGSAIVLGLVCALVGINARRGDWELVVGGVIIASLNGFVVAALLLSER